MRLPPWVRSPRWVASVGDFREITSLLVDNEQMFVFNGIERMFDRHMFAKHSFDVKHLFEILTETTYTPVSVTPQEQCHTPGAEWSHDCNSCLPSKSPFCSPACHSSVQGWAGPCS